MTQLRGLLTRCRLRIRTDGRPGASRVLRLWSSSTPSVHYRWVAVTEEKIAECVAHYRGLLDALPQLPESLSRAPDSRLHVIIERAGAKRRGEALLARLDQAFTDAGIKTHPSLTDADLEPGDRVYMFDAKHPIEELRQHDSCSTTRGPCKASFWPTSMSWKCCETSA